MLGEQFNSLIQEYRRRALFISSLIVIMAAGITFTFVVPGLKGFDWTFLVASLCFYFFVATIFVELSRDHLLFVFFYSLILSSVGMGWRLWLEWGEYSLSEHMQAVVLIGYPIIIALVITLSYGVFPKLHSIWKAL